MISWAVVQIAMCNKCVAVPKTETKGEANRCKYINLQNAKAKQIKCYEKQEKIEEPKRIEKCWRGT